MSAGLRSMFARWLGGLAGTVPQIPGCVDAYDMAVGTADAFDGAVGTVTPFDAETGLVDAYEVAC